AWESSGDELDLRPSGAGLRFQGRRKDGALFPVEISRSPLETEGTVLVSSAIRDVTWRQQAEEELKARASVLKAQALLLDVTNDPIIVRDLESRVIFWNRGAETTYGWSRLEAVGRVSHKLLQTRFPQPLAEIEAALLNDGYWEGEVDHARRDGSRVVVASRRVVQRDEQGKPWRTLEISNNITEKKRTEERIQAPNAGLANRNAEVARGDDDRGESRDSAGRG
ncbi:MAG TPA: PAS domain-containing protein, partial [Terriglobia bacterium]|nr:PAS domain-containing protein [Terriglobia bacterium]